MNRQYRTVIVMIVAVATAGLAAFGVYSAIQRMPVRQVEVGTVEVVVAAEQLLVGTQIRREQLKVVAWPAKTQVPGAHADPKEVIDRGVIATIEVNEPITAAKIASAGIGAGLSPVVPPGMRAMSVKVNEVIGVAGYVVPGTRVDVIVTVRPDNAAGGNQEVMARTVVSNVQVLTAGTRYDTEKGKDGKAQPVSVVTLALLPEDGERVALAQNEGKLSLALRNPLDVDQTNTNGIRLVTLMRGTGPEPVVVNQATRKVAPKPRPAQQISDPTPPPPTRLYKVEAIRGGKSTEEVVN
jgi:pilus assembly protein CpaB